MEGKMEEVVGYVVRGMVCYGGEREDMEQVGRIGYERAVGLYDGRGEFFWYAVMKVRGVVMDYLRKEWRRAGRVRNFEEGDVESFEEGGFGEKVEFWILVEEGIGRYEGRKREAVRMWIEGYSRREIVAGSGLSWGGVSMVVKDFREWFRRAWVGK